MKSLSNYTDKAYGKLFEKYGVFFAFSNEQYNKKALKCVVYKPFFGGGFIPKVNFEAYSKEMFEVTQQCIAQDIEENGKYKIIRRELFNYECFYTGEIDDAVDALEEYGFSYDDVLEVYRKVSETEDVD